MTSAPSSVLLNFLWDVNILWGMNNHVIPRAAETDVKCNAACTYGYVELISRSRC